MVQASSPPITLTDFLQLPETKPASEFVNGKILQKPMPQGQHSRIQQKLVTTINQVTEDPQIALALPELRCTFGNRSIVSDIAIFTWNRLPVDPEGQIINQFQTHPDWVIEILSPDQSVTRVTENILHCISYGTQLGWLIDPNERLVLVYNEQAQTRVLGATDAVLPIPAFVPELTLTIGQVFAWLRLR